MIRTGLHHYMLIHSVFLRILANHIWHNLKRNSAKMLWIMNPYNLQFAISYESQGKVEPERNLTVQMCIYIYIEYLGKSSMRGWVYVRGAYTRLEHAFRCLISICLLTIRSLDWTCFWACYQLTIIISPLCLWARALAICLQSLVWRNHRYLLYL